MRRCLPFLGPLILVLLGGDAVAGDRHALEEARFFLEQGRAAEAYARLRPLAEEEGARSDPTLQALVAEAALAVGDGAAGTTACQLLHTLRHESASAELRDGCAWALATLVPVHFVGAGEPGALVFEPASAVLDPRAKRHVQWVLRELADGEGGTGSSSLPAGTYRVGERVVLVEAGRPARIDVRPGQGELGGGVFGERRAPATVAATGVLVAASGLAFRQQQSAAGSGRLRVTVERGFGGHLRAQVGAALGLGRAERIHASKAAPPAIEWALAGGIAAGPASSGPARIELAALWSLGTAHPAAAGFAPGYAGPRHYLVHGPDLELRVEIQGASPWSFVFGPSFVFRESIPLGPEAASDPRPHLSVGGAWSLGARWGRR